MLVQGQCGPPYSLTKIYKVYINVYVYKCNYKAPLKYVLFYFLFFLSGFKFPQQLLL